MTDKKNLQQYLAKIREDLDKTVNFWIINSHDEDNGGFFTCLGNDGKVFDDLKYGWLQGRQVWMYAKLYNEVERFKRPDILAAAEKGGNFIIKYLKNEGSGKCYFLVTKEGKPVKIQRTIFTECFYVMAMSELAKATKQSKYMEEARSMFLRIKHWVMVDDRDLGRPKLEGETPTNSLAVPMMMLCLVNELQHLQIPETEEMADWAIEKTLAHVQRGGKVILEHVGADGKELPGSQGRLTIPGHVIEGGWFLLQLAQKRKDEDLKKIALDTFMMKPFNNGWDNEYGGLFYYLDVDGWPPTQLQWSQKLWWPHNEAMIAFLMAYKETQNKTYLDLFDKVFNYSYSHFVDEKHGEWYGYLNRDGIVNMNFKGGPFKGCFHVPRCLMMCEQILQQLLQS